MTDFHKAMSTENSESDKLLKTFTFMSTVIILYILHCIAEIRAYLVETKPSEIDNPRDNAAFVCVHVVGKDFSEVRGWRSRGFQLQVEGIMKRIVRLLSLTGCRFAYRSKEEKDASATLISNCPIKKDH